MTEATIDGKGFSFQERVRQSDPLANATPEQREAWHQTAIDLRRAETILDKPWFAVLRAMSREQLEDPVGAIHAARRAGLLFRDADTRRDANMLIDWWEEEPERGENKTHQLECAVEAALKACSASLKLVREGGDD